MTTNNNTVVVSLSTSIIQSGAFADLFTNALAQLPPNSLIDLEINLGPGNIVIEAEAFQQSNTGTLPNGVTLNNASFTFDPNCFPTMGPKSMAGMPVRTLVLPANTTLQANALQNLQALTQLDASKLVNPIVANGMNLSRPNTAPLIVSLPSSPSVTYAAGAIQLPPTSTTDGVTSTTTLVFNGAIPNQTMLSEMFAVNSFVKAPIQVSVNYANTSNATTQQLLTLQSSLTPTGGPEPVAVSFNAVQNVLQGLAQANTIQAGGTITDISQFAGDYFDYCVIAPNAQNVKIINQCVVTSLSANAIKGNVQNIPIPSAIKPQNTSYNVINLVSKMNLNVDSLTSKPFYIIDNYSDPSDATLPSVPLIAIFSKDNAASNTVGSFYPALVCNGTISQQNGSVIVSGAWGVGASNPYCRGYTSRGDGTTNPNAIVNLLTTAAVGSVVQLYDRSISSNVLPIATLSFQTATMFSIQFNPVSAIGNSIDPIVGCFQGYRPVGQNASMVVDFKLVADAGNAAWNAFSNGVATVITNNNALVLLLNQIRNYALPAGVTVNPPLPAVVSISSELAALSQIDFNLALSAWTALHTKYNSETIGYSAYLTAMIIYVNNVITQTGGTTPELVSANSAFNAFKTALVLAEPLVTTNALSEVAGGVSPLYVNVVSNYIQTRFSIGMQAFKNCTVLDRTPNFEFLRNISKVNDETFYFCSVLKSPITIPSNVTSIGTRAYYNCGDSTGIDIQNALALRTIGDSAFEGCSKAAGSLSFSSSIGASKSVERIGNKAFYGCTALTDHIYFPPGLVSLGVSAFETCSNLNGTIVFPNNPQFITIPERAFADCSSITGISTQTGNGTSLMYMPSYAPLTGPIPNGLILPSNITQIGQNAFLNCSSFAGALNLQQSAQSAIAQIGDSAFRGCSSFTSLVLPTSVQYTTVSSGCFRNCSNIASLNLSSNITTILDSAFLGCNKIANVPLLSNVNYIGLGAFSGCSGMIGPLVLGTSLDVLGDRAFYDCTYLTSATFLGPRPLGLSAASLIFGVSDVAGANAPFYVNVFTENGWDGSDLTLVNAILKINTAFRATVNGGKSLVQMAFIDFNTYRSSAASRELTINNYQSFKVYDNTGADGVNVATTAPAGGFSWNDVYIPGTLRGESLTAANNNINQLPLLQKQLSTLITPKVDAVQTDAVNLIFSANNALNAFDGRNTAVAVGTNGEPIVLVATTAGSTTLNGYGVATANQKDYLYYSPAAGTQATLVTSSNAVLSFFVNTDDVALKPKYVNKLISVDSTGVISISSSVTPIGYGTANTPTAVLYTSAQPTTDRTGKGYTIVKSAVPGVLDTMYLDTILAPAGAYFVSVCSVGGTVQVADASKYKAKVIYVKQDGSVQVSESQLNSDFQIISVANKADTVATIPNNPGYTVIIGETNQSGANTPYQLYYKAAEVTVRVAASYYYLIQSSDVPSLNNVMVLVLPNGGISIASFGISGSINALSSYTDEIVAQPIPIYSTNPAFQNFDYYVNGVLPLAQSQYNDAKNDLDAKMTSYSVNDFLPLQIQLGTATSSINNALKAFGTSGQAFVTAFDNLNGSSGTLLTSYNALSGAMSINSTYDDDVTTFKSLVTGTGVNSPLGLNQIQYNSLNNPATGIYQFRRNSTFNENALLSSVDPSTGLTNNLAYVTAQINNFLTELLFMQYTSDHTYEAVVASVKMNVSFLVSPTTDVPPKALLYAGLSTQQKVLFDYVVSFVGLWYNSATAGAAGTAGGNNSWGSKTPLSGLYAVTPGDTVTATKTNILNWGLTHIVAYFNNGGATVYTQFANNNMPNTVASLANIRTSIAMYETTRAAVSNNDDVSANTAAKKAYVGAAAVKVLNIAANVQADTSTQAAPATLLANGKLIFNNADPTASTKLYISLKDSTGVDISFAGYADTIILNGGLTYTIQSITKTENCYTLSVSYVAGTAAAATTPITNGGAVTFFTYQNVSSYTLDHLAAMNTYVWGQYYTMYTDAGGIQRKGIKAYLTATNAKLKTDITSISSGLNQFNTNANDVLQKVNSLNVAEDSMTANLQSQAAAGTRLDLNGANMLARELDLLGYAITNQINSNANTPTVATLPAYESKWFNDRIAAFWAATTSPIPANRIADYTTIHAAFVTKRFARQSAAIDLYIAMTPPAQTISSPVSTAFLSDQAIKIMNTMPAFLGTSTKYDLAKQIGTKIATYVFNRKNAGNNLNGNALSQALAKYQADQQTAAIAAMQAANTEYGNAAYQRYIAVIDLAISFGYYAGLQDQDPLSAGTNVFQTLMQQWNASSNKSPVFEQLKPLLFNFVYTTDNTVYSTNSFPLKSNVGAAASPIIAWFGNPTKNGFLYQIIANGLSFVTDATKCSTGIPYSNYTPTTNTIGGFQLTTASPELASDPTQLPTLSPFSTSLSTPNTTNAAAAVAAASAITSLQYNVSSIGYASLPTSQMENLTSLGFTDVTNTLSFNISQLNDTLLYKFKTNNDSWQFGYQQSSNLINSWSKLSPNQNVVAFYPGNDQNTPPANLYESSQTGINALCDNASYVMTIEAIADSTVKAISLYTYDVMGITSGSLIAIGTLTPAANSAIPVVKLYSVAGALQKAPQNPTGSTAGINLVGELVIPSQVKTIGIQAFANASQVKSLQFNAGTANSVVVGSNAFEFCSALSAINLGPTIASIGPSAFLKCTGATSLSLPPTPSTFSVVNHWVFLGCSSLGSSATNGNLVLNASLNQINVQAFAGCTKLQCSQLNGSTSYIPQQLQKIGLGAFIRCVGLTGALNFNNVNQNGKFVSSIGVLGSAAFMGCVGLTGALSLPDNAAYKNVLPYTFASVDAPLFSVQGVQMAFAQTPSPVAMALSGVVDLELIPVVTTVERNAFYKCAALSSINLSNTVTSVGIQSFMNCSGLQSALKVPASVKSIGNEAFRSCSGLTGLNIVSTMVSQAASEAWLSLGNSCFQDCTSLALSNTANGLVIPNTVGSIGDRAFQGCVSIVSVNVGSGLKNANSFGSLVFNGCTKLERVVLAFSFMSKNVVGQSVVKNAVLPNPNTGGATYNASFTSCTALGVPSDTPVGTIQIQSGATGWTPGRAVFFNNLTIVINNKNITFYLSEFNQNITVVDPTTETMQQTPIPNTDAQATVYVKASDMRSVFLTSTDSFVNQDQIAGEGTDHGQLFFVRPEYFPQYLNVSNAHVTLGGIESYNAAVYEQLVKDDVMRYYAMSLFNSSDWVTLFANDTEMIENMVASSGLMPIVPDGDSDANGKNLYNTGVLYNIMSELNKISYTKPVGASPLLVRSTNYPATTNKWWGLPDTVSAENPQGNNIGKKLFNLINRNDPGRITSMVLNGATPSELPFLPGDQFIFVFTLNENKVTLAPNVPPVVVKKRTYLIKLMLTDDFNSGTPAFMDHAVALYAPSPINQNVLPVSGAYAADYMYSDYKLHLAIKPSVLNQTANSVYSRVTQNTYEPIAMPQVLLPFTGWYYSYPYNTQSIKLDFTPPDLSVTNKILYNDMRYLSAYVYFPENWASMVTSALPSANNFPQWVVKFTNTDSTVTFKFKAGFLNANAETINYLGQTVPFDYANSHIQLVCPFDLTSAIPQFGQSQLNALLAGKTADGAQSGTINTIAATDIWRQRSQAALVSGLRKSTSTVGPFTYPPVARGYQCIPMATTTANGLQQNQIQIDGDQNVNNLFVDLTAVNSQYYLQSVALEINMSNNSGFVPSVIVKSVEVVAKNYEAYYLAPLDPN